jgi:alpha-galactosidase
MHNLKHQLMNVSIGLWYLIGISSLFAQIQIDKNPLRWTLSSDNATCQIILASDGDLTPGYFGPTAGAHLLEAPYGRSSETVGTIIREIPYRGGFVDMEPAVEAVFSDHVRELELRYSGHEVFKIDGYPCLRLDMKDTHYPFTVSEFIRIIPENDIFEKWLVLHNTGDANIRLERTASGSVVLPKGRYDLLHYTGDWGREFLPERTALTGGLKSLKVHALSRSHQYPPFFAVQPQGESEENNGDVWFGSLAWTGSWRLDFFVNRYEITQINGGINDWDTHWNLSGGEKFETPKLILGIATDGTNGASRRLHRYQLEHILPKPLNNRPHKLLYNSWYATLMDVNIEQQVDLAKVAADLGVELFAMDDGWFKARTGGNIGLGDWTPDPIKFPNGLGPLIEQVAALGMEFGLWVEPEMVSLDSDLYRAHPDWILHTPNRALHYQGRGQYMLNFAREDVKQYMIRVLDTLLSENDIKFIKWDSNRHASEIGWPDAEPDMQRELRIRYIRNLYEIFQTLRERHPDVVFESCSGGGGRVELGILQYVDQVWTSDNTDPGDRLRIQYGFSYAFPAKIMTNWVTDHEWHNKTTSLRFRFLVAMAGNLGIGNDIGKWTAEERALATDLIEQYKDVRDIIQLGDQYRLRSPFEGTQTAVQFVTQNGRETVVFAFQTLETESMRSRYNPRIRVKLHGLNPEKLYQIKGEDGPPVSGKALMSSGLEIPLNGNYDGKMVVLKQKTVNFQLR